MYYVHNQWYDISCATLYYTIFRLQKTHFLYGLMMSFVSTVLKLLVL